MTTSSGVIRRSKRATTFRIRASGPKVQTLRVGCIGRVGEAAIPRAVAAIADTLKAMDVRRSRLSAEAAA